MNCPYCHTEMEKGYVDETRALFPIEWYPAKREPGILVSRKRNIRLTSCWKTGNVIMHHCADCRKFIIDQDEIEV